MVKLGLVINSQTLMNIVEKYDWSRNAEEEIIRDDLSYDVLYTKLSAFIVIWENEVKRSEHNFNKADNKRTSNKNQISSPSFIANGDQYSTSRKFHNRAVRHKSAQNLDTRN